MDMSQTTPTHPPTPPLDTPALRLAGRLREASDASVDAASMEQLLEEARALLATLKIDRARVEARLAELGRDDPIELVRGRSALDAGIEACQQAIERLDRTLLDARPSAGA